MKKYCKKCGKYIDIKLFSKDKNRPDGLSFYCKKHLKEIRDSNRVGARNNTLKDILHYSAYWSGKYMGSGSNRHSFYGCYNRDNTYEK